MINLLTHYIRKLLDSFRDTIKIIKHFDLIKLNGKLIIFKIFVIRFFYSFGFIRNFKKVLYKNEPVNKRNNLRDIYKKLSDKEIFLNNFQNLLKNI